MKSNVDPQRKTVDFPTRNLLLFFAGILFFYIVYLGQEIILPFVFSGILAILLNPFVNYLEKRRWNRIIASAVIIIIAIILITCIVLFFVSQLTMFGDTLPLWRGKFNQLTKEIINWVSGTFHLSSARVSTWLDQLSNQGVTNTTLVIGHTVTTVFHIVVTILLIPFYVFLILLYKQLLLTFMGKIISNDKHETVVDVLNESKLLIQSYLIGLLLEAFIVAILDSVSLLLIGIDYAVMIGILCALLNVIPYAGGIIALVLTMLFALVTKSPFAAVLVLLAHLAVQLIDNNYIVPKVVGSKVKINALASLLVVLIGGALYGIAGMFLSIPITAIVKVICDRIDTLKPIGFLLGDTLPLKGKQIFNVSKTIPLSKEIGQSKRKKKPG